MKIYGFAIIRTHVISQDLVREVDMEQIIDYEKCCGCKVCYDICGQEAISFEVNNEGFWYPVVDQNKCTSCLRCREVCPDVNPVKNQEQMKPQVYAAWLKDTQMRQYSTSGGMYYAFAHQVLTQGGYVVACRYTGDWKHAEHIVADSEELLLETVRSKYFQSETEGIYKKVKELLGTGKQVLFCGCPCQSAALQAYVGECENLFTMDFICRGINSQRAFAAFIEELEHRYHSKATGVHCKNKRKGWKSLGVLVTFENGEEYYETRSSSYWSLGYIKENLYMRPSCHQCQYRNLPRISDITIGDFWGIQNVTEDDLFHGISVLMLNTGKGQAMFQSIRDKLEYSERTIEDVKKGNPCLTESPAKGSKREMFFQLLNEKEFSEAVRECCGDLGC